MFEALEESFPKREERILEFWKKEKIFEKSLEKTRQGDLFSFYDGPPFATGLPHYGHLLAGTIKDVIPRYKTMQGFHVPRRFGWDCHGLPVENEIEKAKELRGAEEIENFGIANFNEECRSIVLRYTNEWKKTVERMGRFVDMEHTYRTMDKDFMESVWWVFKQLFDQGLIYEGFKVMPFSTTLGTPLSNFEATSNYKEIDDPSLTVTFQLEEEVNTYFLVWTTTPWTLLSNLALTAAASLIYVKIKDLNTGRFYILAKARLEHYFKDAKDYEIVKEMRGVDLNNKTYVPLFPYFADRKAAGAFRVILDDFVSTEEGTGLVHTAPAFGEEDFFACKKENIELVCPVDANGRFTDEVPEFSGQLVRDSNKQIVRDLKEKGLVFHLGTVRHRYPFCWRTDTPLIYKAVATWFVAVEKLKDKLIAANQKIHWMPEHIKDGRFGKWLENARDWAISRNRYWGTPIPLWHNGEGDIIVFGSVEDLEKKVKEKITDLHRHYLDHLTFEHNGKTYRRIPEVFDCWFESGSMPYGQNHYPFENKEETEKSLPADFIGEGLDQTRGWFYTLNVLSAALFNQPAFKNVIVNGIILAEDGTKMSKRLKNYPEPTEVIDRFGADSVRLYMLNSPAVRAEDLAFSARGVELTLRQALLPLWNSFSFLCTYAKIYQFQPDETTGKNRPKAKIDLWILSLVNQVLKEVKTALDQYDLNRAVEPLIGFIDQLTNWYIRRSRSRFWADENTSDRKEAFETLYSVLMLFVQMSAPFNPFISEAVYQELRTAKMPLSVHLCSFPEVAEKLRDEKLEREMALAQKTVSLGHMLRKEAKLKVRQPLSKARISASKEILTLLKAEEKLIAEELNVKELEFFEEATSFVKLVVKPNFRVLGKKVGALMGAVQKAVFAFDHWMISELKEGRQVKITVEGQELVIAPEDVEISRIAQEGVVATADSEIAIALETTLSEALILEGLARELVNKINTLRKELDYAVTDRIEVVLQTTSRVKAAFEKHFEYITGEILAVKVEFKACTGLELDLSGEKTVLAIEKSAQQG
ncbi:MAG: isoleucine--tRNA ligase [Parachlamydiales bacterium]|jgi:isoleucyl-tRNA synthetase